MIIALVLFVVAVLIIAVAMLIESRQNAQIEAQRNIGNYARKAQNLSQALYVMPRGYLPQEGLLKILGEIERCADAMVKSGLPQMTSQGRSIKAEVTAQRDEIKQSGTAGPGVANITTKQKVEIVREAAKYLHGFLVKQLSKNPQYCQSPQDVLTALDFSRFRVVVDFFNNMAKVQMKEDDPYKARLALERAAGLLKPWVDKVAWASHAYEDYSKRIRQLKDAEPKVTGSEKEWDDWEAACDWKKKPVYD